MLECSPTFVALADNDVYNLRLQPKMKALFSLKSDIDNTCVLGYAQHRPQCLNRGKLRADKLELRELTYIHL